MGIWIRSQDKDDLFYAKIVEICKRKNDYAVLLNGIDKSISAKRIRSASLYAADYR